MASEKFTREYGNHLVDEVLKGRMTRRQLLVRASVFGFSATATAQLLAACGSSGGTSASPSASAMPSPVMGGTLKAQIPPETAGIDPLTIFDQGGIVLVYQFLEYLVTLDNTNALKPMLALSWTPNNDASVWTFKLRQGVKFNNGQPFEAEDVVKSIDRALNPKGASGALAALGGILKQGSTVATDTYTVTFNLEKPFADFPYLVCVSSYNTAILPRNYGGDIVKEPVGTGPFMIKPNSYVPKQKISFVKNPNYWGKDSSGTQLPYLDGIDFTMIQDEAAANAQLQAGAIDVEPQTVYQGAQALFADPNLRVDVYPGSGIREVAFNVNKSPWQKKELRQAIAYCLDRKAINETLYAGRSNLGYDTFWQPTVFPGSPTPPERAQDYNKAKQLLAAGGMPNGFTATLTTSKYLENPQLVQLIQAQCKPAGITVKPNIMSPTAYYAGSNANTPWLNAPWSITEWGSRPTPSVYVQAMLLPDSTWNTSHWNNPQFVSSFNSYVATPDAAARTKYATQCSQIQQDETPIILPFYISQLRTQRKNVYGIQGPGSFFFFCTQAFKTAS